MRDRLEQQLAALKRRNLIRVWHDRDITAGTEWSKEIDRELKDADLILLLVSAAFLDSDFCVSTELQQAVKRHQNEEALVIPVMLKPCDVEGTAVALLQQVPKNGKPISTWSNRDSAYLDAVKQIKVAVEAWSGVKTKKSSLAQRIEAGTDRPVSPKEFGSGSLPLTFSKVFGRDRYQTPEWLQAGLQRAHSVARIERKSGTAVGTGFLVSGRDVLAEDGDALLLVTCSYVVSPDTDGTRFGGVPYSDTVVNFELAGIRRRVESVVWSSHPNSCGRSFCVWTNL
jgi:hypothetical protein